MAHRAQHRGVLVAVVLLAHVVAAATTAAAAARSTICAVALGSRRHLRSSGPHLPLVRLAALPLRPTALARHVAAARHQRLAWPYRGVMKFIVTVAGTTSATRAAADAGF